ncbi:Uncharacterised protein [uncultured archaeon]|nr:Uncharacterised protein [uncultured archaeon]
MSSNSLSSISMDTPSRTRSKNVLLPCWVVLWKERKTPDTTTLSPGATMPARSSSTSTSSVCGCSPPRRSSGDSCTRSFCASMKSDSSGTILNGPFLPHTSFSHSKGSTNLPSPCGIMVTWSHLWHLNAALMIFGLTSVAFLMRPDTDMNLFILALRSSLI